jgi:hypothetical protein|tara:strand:- start:456 stop:971 length:516 start_codon:yes stop_codon:yes gene_type:complete
MKYLAMSLLLIITGIIVWMNVEIHPRVPPESAVRVVRSDNREFVVWDGADLGSTYGRLHQLFANVSPGDQFQILVEPLPQNQMLASSEIDVRVFPNGDVSLFSDDDTGAINRNRCRGSSSGGSGDFIAMSLMSEIGYPFMSDETKESARIEVNRLLGAEMVGPNSGESSNP